MWWLNYQSEQAWWQSYNPNPEVLTEEAPHKFTAGLPAWEDTGSKKIIQTNNQKLDKWKTKIKCITVDYAELFMLIHCLWCCPESPLFSPLPFSPLFSFPLFSPPLPLSISSCIHMQTYIYLYVQPRVNWNSLCSSW